MWHSCGRLINLPHGTANWQLAATGSGFFGNFVKDERPPGAAGIPRAPGGNAGPRGRITMAARFRSVPQSDALGWNMTVLQADRDASP
jgi:hypothetical protein